MICIIVQKASKEVKDRTLETFKATHSFTQGEHTIGTDLLALGEALFESDKRDKLMETPGSCGIQSGVF